MMCAYKSLNATFRHFLYSSWRAGVRDLSISHAALHSGCLFCKLAHGNFVGKQYDGAEKNRSLAAKYV